MFVPLNHEGVKGWSFKFVCPGYALSISHERLLLLKNATVNRNLGFDEVCKEKRVSIAFNNEEWVFWAYGVPGNMQMYRYPVTQRWGIALLLCCLGVGGTSSIF